LRHRSDRHGENGDHREKNNPHFLLIASSQEKGPCAISLVQVE
jgi:hypothetical protein